jgi:sugar fermentation stimulation protein A
MRYDTVQEARFLERLNRFVARVETENGVEAVHVKNTGRCRELLVPGAAVWLARETNPARKYAWDLICAKKERPGEPPLLVNLDSQAPNRAVGEWLRAGNLLPDAAVRAEAVHGTSRFDFALEDGAGTFYLEVKGCTLERDGVAAFPDAPTARGARHLRELTAWAKLGNRAAVFFLIQMRPVQYFTPNEETDPAFADALREAAAAGVQILAYDSLVTPESLAVGRPIDVILDHSSRVSSADTADTS